MSRKRLSEAAYFALYINSKLLFDLNFKYYFYFSDFCHHVTVVNFASQKNSKPNCIVGNVGFREVTFS